MINGLPSLIDAIFGKKDLASVSLDEMYEVISEFPSFNAAHFLLSKKLAMENSADYEKVSMRTALYFNNPLWLEASLTDGRQWAPVELPEKIIAKQEDFVPELSLEVSEQSKTEEEFHFPHEPFEEKIQAPEEAVADAAEPLDAEPATTDTVTSFDELMKKYSLDVTEPGEQAVSESIQSQAVVPEFTEPETAFVEQSVPVPEHTETVVPEFTEPETESSEPIVYGSRQTESGGSEHSEPQIESSGREKPDTVTPEEPAVLHDFKNTTPDPENENLQEVLNEYGIFEEVIVKTRDHDLDAFDRPFEINESVREKSSATEQVAEIPVVSAEIIPAEASVTEAPVKSNDADYEAFDGPLEEVTEPTASNGMEVEEMNAFLNQTEADDTGSSEVFSGEGGELRELVSRFGEKQKSMPLFDSKKAESIVFAPYHMIDYFASQGIKLVLEDQPSDSFGKQLKSFTDWLKVMKKVPAQQGSDKIQEKEADQIRHFAAHSIEERDIMTESMAEVLAKQGMYENAIALFQKLSLIYPPKSAYFASRIEQLKASLP
jgi:hypothetical protein